MRTLCPNLDNEDGLETVLEVPIPEESFDDTKINNNNTTSWQTMKSWMKPHSPDKKQQFSDFGGGRNAEIQLLLGVVGAPLVPLPIFSKHLPFKSFIQDHPIESSMAKYILQQYIAAAGGEKALSLIDSMCAVGKVKMVATEFNDGDGITVSCGGKAVKAKSVKNNGGEMGGFVLWQKKPDLWSLELVVSGYKITAGSDGKVAWRQTPWHQSHASRGPPRPLRRSLQGLDPKSTANLFTNSICIGEKTINGEDCFVLKLEPELQSLKLRSSNNVEIMKHTIWGYFSQRTGLLYQLKDSHLIRINTPGSDSVFWETTMESLIQDYRTIDGINIAHGGKTTVSLFRFGEDTESHSQTKMEEVWTIEEVDFNIKGLSMDCFLPPSDLKKEDDQPIVKTKSSDKLIGSARFASKSRGNSSRFGVPKIVAIDSNSFNSLGDL
ncbi:hypothetical protein HanXRQr2_Chr14g0665691 [Helianthus annuus]|uniref:Uncharacterized protein n=1 Tax=Helianthus annuus TaxID=4232 RepID=A0A251SLZ0_HELAN|nr:uncharacterized protein LOC110904830 [Helianthus annuus]KAF5771002.1 hypothetical protein HanXRQr2_Chr14g0665691 [Helianthus annuus]KAJ0470781.1 hypothetical protein HanIR_Chr14g0722461 [Helianthus annuus]KAJ0487444.1 hypothetical protein HanHA89_Chr14g0590441 [Helianthus annuus]KAJ0657885.1 hypothetical protein HanLR1_Chr14g0551621 [Helianthus annuus]KAJ0842187.1 hypothetical protein HanPSC8_Chr14g0638811 [Helianthus annuus]